LKASTLVLALLLAACSTPQTRFNAGISGYQEMCSRMGYQPGPQMATCIQNLYAQDEQSAAQRRAAASTLGNVLLTQPVYVAPQAPQVCRWIGPNWVCQ
jgi:hypothetical protein